MFDDLKINLVFLFFAVLLLVAIGMRFIPDVIDNYQYHSTDAKNAIEKITDHNAYQQNEFSANLRISKLKKQSSGATPIEEIIAKRKITIEKSIIDPDTLEKIKKNKKIDEVVFDQIDEISKSKDKNKNRIKIIIESDDISSLDLENTLHDSSKLEKQLGNRLISLEIDPEKLQELADNKDILKIHANRQYSMLLDQSIPLTEANSIWNNYTGNNINIAILDTGMDFSHPMLAGRILESESFIDNDPSDHNGHGTHVAGIAAGNGYNEGYYGAAPDAGLYNAKVLDDTGSGTTSSIYDGIMWAIDPDGDPATDDAADIISISIGAPYSTPDLVINSALQDAIDNGIVVIIASGNCGPGGSCFGYQGVTVPGNYEDAITVGAVDDNLQWASFSSGEDFGTYIKPDIVAPGVAITSSSVNNGYATKSGTSMSAPMVAGIVALLLEKNNTLDHYQVKSILESNAVDLGDTGKDTLYGSGFVNASLIFDGSTFSIPSTNESNSSNTGNKIVKLSEYGIIESDIGNFSYHSYINSSIHVNGSITDKLGIYQLANELYYVRAVTFPNVLEFNKYLIKLLSINNNSRFVNYDYNYIFFDNKSYWFANNRMYSLKAPDETHVSELLDTYSLEFGNDIGINYNQTWNVLRQLDIGMMGMISERNLELREQSNKTGYNQQSGGSTWQNPDNYNFGSNDYETYTVQGADNWYFTHTSQPGPIEIGVVNIGSNDDLDLEIYDYDHSNFLCYAGQYGNVDEVCILPKTNTDDWGYLLNIIPYTVGGGLATGTIVSSGGSCTEGYTNNYDCNGDIRRREYQYSDCTTEWDNWEYCNDYDGVTPWNYYCDEGDIWRSRLDSDWYCSIDECIGSSIQEDQLHDDCTSNQYCDDSIPGSPVCEDNCIDNDNDGVTDCAGDCNDNNPNNYPGNIETCDGQDNNCNSQIDEGVLNACGTCGTCHLAGIYSFVPSLFEAGQTTQATVRILNEGDAGTLIVRPTDVPSGWSVSPNNIQYFVNTNNFQNFVFDITAPNHAETNFIEWSLYYNLPTDELLDSQHSFVESEVVCSDNDGDGMTDCAGDCDDTDPNNYQGNTETCDWQDNDCDYDIDEGINNCCSGNIVDMQTDNNNCGACGITCNVGESCIASTCTPAQYCGDGTCDAGETENNCPNDCQVNHELLINNVMPVSATEGQQVDIRVSINSNGSYDTSRFIEVAIVPESWAGIAYPSSYGPMQFYNYTPPCDLNPYYEHKIVDITTPGIAEQEVFTVTAPTQSSIDNCNSLGSAWDPNGQFRIIAGTFHNLQGGNGYDNFVSIPYMVNPIVNCVFPYGDSAACSCNDPANDCGAGYYCDSNVGYGTCVENITTTCTIPDGSASDCDCDRNSDCEIYGDYICNLGPDWDACIASNTPDECNIIDQYECKNDDVYRCEQIGARKELILVEACTYNEVCPDDVATSMQCASLLDYDMIIEHASAGTIVNKQRGDKLRLSILSNQAVSFNFEYDQNAFTLTQGNCNIGSFGPGVNTCEFDVIGYNGDYTFKFGEDEETVKIISDPYSIYVTNVKQLYRRYSDVTGINVLLAKTYEKASQNNGLVYDMDKEITTVGMPFDYAYSNYNQDFENVGSVSNDYSEAVGTFVNSKCNGCNNIVVVGDDYVVPNYRSHIVSTEDNLNDIEDWFDYFFRSNKDHFLLNDLPLIGKLLGYAEEETEDLFDLSFLGRTNYQGKEVYFIVPDTMSSELNQAYLDLNQTVSNLPMNPHIYEMRSSDISCNYHGWTFDGGDLFGVHNIFRTLDDATVIIIGDRSNNNALGCYPFIHHIGTDIDNQILIQPSVWDQSERAIIIDSNLVTIKSFDLLLKTGTYENYRSYGWKIFDSTVFAGTIIMIPFTLGTSAVASTGMTTGLVYANTAIETLDVISACHPMVIESDMNETGICMFAAIPEIGMPTAKAMGADKLIIRLIELSGKKGARLIKNLGGIADNAIAKLGNLLSKKRADELIGLFDTYDENIVRLTAKKLSQMDIHHIKFNYPYTDEIITEFGGVVNKYPNDALMIDSAARLMEKDPLIAKRAYLYVNNNNFNYNREFFDNFYYFKDSGRDIRINIIGKGDEYAEIGSLYHQATAVFKVGPTDIDDINRFFETYKLSKIDESIRKNFENFNINRIEGSPGYINDVNIVGELGGEGAYYPPSGNIYFKVQNFEDSQSLYDFEYHVLPHEISHAKINERLHGDLYELWPMADANPIRDTIMNGFDEFITDLNALNYFDEPAIYTERIRVYQSLNSLPSNYKNHIKSYVLYNDHEPILIDLLYNDFFSSSNIHRNEINTALNELRDMGTITQAKIDEFNSLCQEFITLANQIQNTGPVSTSFLNDAGSSIQALSDFRWQ